MNLRPPYEGLPIISWVVSSVCNKIMNGFQFRVLFRVPVPGPDLHLVLTFTTIYCKMSYLEFATAVRRIAHYLMGRLVGV